MMTLVLVAALLADAQVIDVTRGPVATTTVAVTVMLDPEGRVLSCRSASAAGACAGFPKGRTVASPIRKGGKPVNGKMTVSTTTVVSEATIDR